MAVRFHLRRHNPYSTRSNKVKRVKAPGGKIVIQNVSKKKSRTFCGDSQMPLNGIKAGRNAACRRMKARQRHVSRAYGGALSHKAVRERIIRAFLVEEQRCAKEVILEKVKERKEDSKPVQAVRRTSKKTIPSKST